MRAAGYLREILPEGEGRMKVRKTAFAGLERRRRCDSGGLLDARNIDTTFLPAIASAPGAATVLDGRSYNDLRCMYATHDRIFTIYRADGVLYADSIESATGAVRTAVLKGDAENDAEDRCVVAFNRYTSPLDPLSGGYERVLLVFPDCKYCPADTPEGFGFLPMSAAPMPELKYAVVHQSRVFGVDGDRIYASAFNDFSDWELDTAEDISAQNAWATTSQSDTRAAGGFTAVASCDGYAVCFRRDFMQQLYNNKNPFRVVDIGGWGCLSDRAHCVWHSNLAFCSDKGVFLYSGGYPRLISERLAVSDWSGALLAASGELLYVYLPSEERVFVYENTGDSWGERRISGINALCSDGKSVYAATDGGVLRLDGGDWGEFSFSTDFMSLGVENPKRVCGVAVTAELSQGAKLTMAVCTADGRERDTAECTASGMHVLRAATGTFLSDFVGLRFYGTGKVTVYGVSLSVSAAHTPGGV